MVTTLSDPETRQRVVEATSGTLVAPIFDYVVTGRQTYSGHVLSAARLIFKSGASLVFDASIVRRTANLFIFAKEIVSEDAQAPGTITWEDLPALVPVPRGYGAGGADNGSIEGSAGGAGGTGPTGMTGESGYNAPALTIIVNAVPGG